MDLQFWSFAGVACVRKLRATNALSSFLTLFSEINFAFRFSRQVEGDLLAVVQSR
jgi:hypothetical protein